VAGNEPVDLGFNVRIEMRLPAWEAIQDTFASLLVRELKVQRSQLSVLHTLEFGDVVAVKYSLHIVRNKLPEVTRRLSLPGTTKKMQSAIVDATGTRWKRRESGGLIISPPALYTSGTTLNPFQAKVVSTVANTTRLESFPHKEKHAPITPKCHSMFTTVCGKDIQDSSKCLSCLSIWATSCSEALRQEYCNSNLGSLIFTIKAKMDLPLWNDVKQWVLKALSFILKEPQQHIMLQHATSVGDKIYMKYKLLTEPSKVAHAIEVLHSDLMIRKLKFMIHSIASSAVQEYWRGQDADALSISLEDFVSVPFSVRVHTSLRSWRKTSGMFLQALATLLHVPVTSIAETKVIQSGKMIGLVYILKTQKDLQKAAVMALSSSKTVEKLQKWIPADSRGTGGLAITPKFVHK
jgi:hypothetical protein